MGSFKDLIPLFLPSVDSSSNGSCVINGEVAGNRTRQSLLIRNASVLAYEFIKEIKRPLPAS